MVYITTYATGNLCPQGQTHRHTHTDQCENQSNKPYLQLCQNEKMVVIGGNFVQKVTKMGVFCYT